jgi:hypothetical protein
MLTEHPHVHSKMLTEHPHVHSKMPQLRSEVERLRGVVRAELAWHEPKPDGFRQRPICRVCSELSRSSDNRWACSAGMRLSAALAELEGD